MQSKFKIVCIVVCLFGVSCTDDVPKRGSLIINHTRDIQTSSAFDTTGAKKFDSFKVIPSDIKKYLDSLEGKAYLIADPGQPFSAGCSQLEGIPGRQFVWAAMKDGFFVMEYRQGGIALFRCLLTINMGQGKISGHNVKYL